MDLSCLELVLYCSDSFLYFQVTQILASHMEWSGVPQPTRSKLGSVKVTLSVKFLKDQPMSRTSVLMQLRNLQFYLKVEVITLILSLNSMSSSITNRHLDNFSSLLQVLPVVCPY